MAEDWEVLFHFYVEVFKMPVNRIFFVRIKAASMTNLSPILEICAVMTILVIVFVLFCIII